MSDKTNSSEIKDLDYLSDDKFAAISNNNAKEIQTLIDEKIEFTSEDLSSAIIHNSPDVVKLLLNKVTATSEDITTTIIHNRPKITEILLEAGVRPVSENVDIAIIHDSPDVVKLLLNKVRATFKHITTTIEHNRPKIAQILLEEGVKPISENINDTLSFGRKDIFLNLIKVIDLTSSQKELAIEKFPDLKNTL